MMIDTHCHIHFKAFENNRDEVIARAKEKNMILNLVGTQESTSKKGVDMAEKYDWMYATIGLHPIHIHEVDVYEETTNFTSRGEDFNPEFYRELAKNPRVIAVGETGLDRFHIPKDQSEKDILAAQSDVFRKHYDVAEESGLPLVMHVRDAHDEMIDLLQQIKKEKGSLIRGVVHCYTGNWAQAEKYLELGFNLGFTGVVTFPAKKTNPEPQLELEKVVANIPLDRILVETDAPFLAPQAYRGEQCEPWMVEEVIKKFAAVRGKTIDEMTSQINQNTLHLFTRIKLAN
ncbi:MAG TPA: TatD family hydrolase [Candidatus Magasanikbacteria bacterium]|nr:TatD family hydrolase [Candidatus Magasanikbacteria bacterium]